MTTELKAITSESIRALLIPANANKDVRSRVGKFCDWLMTTGGKPFEPDLSAYRDVLQGKLNAATVAAHLSTIRSQYTRLLRDNHLRAELYTLACASLTAQGHADTPANRAAFVTEALERLRNAIDAKNSSVTVIKSQDRADAAQTRLTKAQAEALLTAPGVVPLERLRDTALIALLLCTGVREAEAISLDMVDLRQQLGGELALHIRLGKGSKERLIPYGDLSWVLAILDKWLSAADITEGKVFRSFWHGGRVLRGELSLRAVENIVGKYPVMIKGTLRHVKPHDLRRTYAHRLYEAGLDLMSISQNLGHASTKTTELYIGELGADKRRAPGVYSFDLTALDEVDMFPVR